MTGDSCGCGPSIGFSIPPLLHESRDPTQRRLEPGCLSNDNNLDQALALAPTSKSTVSGRNQQNIRHQKLCFLEIQNTSELF